MRATWACLMVFFILGVSSSSWVSRLPALRDALHLAPTDLAQMLLIGSLGSLVALPSSGPLVGRIGARATTRVGVGMWTAGIVGVALAAHVGSRMTLSLCLIAVCCGSSLWSATGNIEGGLVEAARRRVILDKLHAMFSAGMVAGALVGAALAGIGVSVTAHLLVTGLLVLIVTFVSSHFYLSEDEVASFSAVDGLRDGEADAAAAGDRERAGGRTWRAWRERRTVLVALMVLSGGLLEGAANDWLALSMIDGYHLPAAQASAVLSLFLAVMATVRLASTGLHRRFRADRLLQVLMLSACAGLALVSFAPATWLALVGVVLWAAGAALVFPTGASALSKEPEMTAARVSVLSTINYGAFLIGPPVLGLMAETVGYHRAMIVLVAPVALAIALAPNVRRVPGADQTDAPAAQSGAPAVEARETAETVAPAVGA
ncbi:MAG: MFS transporter [Actinomyces sp.]|nr:MFS transporter [Actinomyces sp.]MCI1787225.1 MFS transporter [Actinomyces sp.]MCI1829619.1 MFS transporter [Actinomyces sp.]MCI1866684.1 MFS transporter [Actinomyces sp.]